MQAKQNKKNTIITADDLKTLRPSVLWTQFKREPAYFWFICGYLFIEYVRPQSVQPVLDIMPYAQIFILLSIVSLFTEKNIYKVSLATNKLIVGFALVMCVSMLQGYFGVFELDKLVDRYLVWVVVYFLIIHIVNDDKRFFIFFTLYVLWNIKMTQHGFKSWAMSGFGFTSYGVSCGPGFFQNSGECGAQMAVFVPLSLTFCVGLKGFITGWKYKLLWLLPVSAMATAIASSSRGAVLACAVAVLWLTIKSPYRVKALASFVLVGVLALAVIPDEFMERFESAGDDDTSKSRLMYWENGLDMMKKYPVLGVGFAQWLPYYARFYPVSNLYGVQLPHNIFIEVGAELGYVGLSVFLLLIFNTLYVNYKTRKICGNKDTFIFYMAHGFDAAMLGFLVAGFFVTITYYPYFWVNLAFTVALHISTRRKYANAKDTKSKKKKTDRHNNTMGQTRPVKL